MAHKYFRFIDGKMIEVTHGAPAIRVQLIGDTMAPTQSIIDGQKFDSKSAYREHLHRNDCHIREDTPQVVHDRREQLAAAKEGRTI
jgi:hypothetical protein